MRHLVLILLLAACSSPTDSASQPTAPNLRFIIPGDTSALTEPIGFWCEYQAKLAVAIGFKCGDCLGVMMEFDGVTTAAGLPIHQTLHFGIKGTGTVYQLFAPGQGNVPWNVSAGALTVAAADSAEELTGSISAAITRQPDSTSPGTESGTMQGTFRVPRDQGPPCPWGP
jgi:hypothetical protein